MFEQALLRFRSLGAEDEPKAGNYLLNGLQELGYSVSLARDGAGELAERLQIVYRGVREVIQTYGPVTMGIEKVFMAKNADSALKLGQARGAAIVAGAEEGMEIAEYTATQVKQAVVGTGAANKEQVQMMVMHMLKLTSKPQIDASDALAIALCHAHTRSSLLPHGLGAARSRGGRLRL